MVWTVPPSKTFNKLGYDIILIYRQSHQDLVLCDHTFARYSEKCFFRIYRTLLIARQRNTRAQARKREAKINPFVVTQLFAFPTFRLANDCCRLVFLSQVTSDVRKNWTKTKWRVTVEKHSFTSAFNLFPRCILIFARINQRNAHRCIIKEERCSGSAAKRFLVKAW